MVELESNLKIDDELSMDMIDQFLGSASFQKRVIASNLCTIIIDLHEDRLYILVKTGKEHNGRTILRVKRIFVWTRLVEILLRRGSLL